MDEIKDLIEKIEALFEKEQYQEIIDLLHDDLLGRYNNADLYVWRGNSRDRKGEFDKAIEDYTKAIELKSDYAIAYFNKGLMWGKKGEQEKAIADY